MAHAPGTALGSYRLLGLLGRGGMGEVYRAKDPRLSREVAIKVLPAGFAEDAERLRRFELEARAVSALNHPNILTVYELGVHEGAPFLVMELLEGETLRAAMAAGPMASGRVAELGEQIAAGLAAAHERGIVHRDLKPENLFITRDGVVKILDFGLAKRSQLESLDSTAAMGVATASGTVMGTLSYMSPEQATGKPVEFPSDQFSFGVVLYELLSGKRPFSGESAAETLAAIVRDDPAPLEELSPGVPAGLAAIVKRCLAKDAKDRYGTTKELARALAMARLHAHTDGTAATGFQPVKAPGRSRPSLRWYVAGGVAALLVAASGLYFWRPWTAVPKPQFIPSVLALPAKVLGSQEAAFLTDAIPESLSTLLMGVEGLDTKLPPSSLQVEKLQGDYEKLAGIYNVQHLVRTTVTAQGESLVLNVQLVDATGQKVRWAGQFEGTRATYNQMAKQVAEALAGALRPGRGMAATTDAPESSEVELALQEAAFFLRRYWATGEPELHAKARVALDRAHAWNDQSAKVAVRMAWLWNSKHGRDGDLKALAESAAWVRRALALDPRNGSAWSALASTVNVRSLDDFDQAFGWVIKAVRLAPRDAGVNGSLGGIAPGPLFMVACGLRSLELDPLGDVDAGMAASGLVWLGRPAEALPVLDRGLAVSPDATFLLNAKAFALARLGRVQEAETVLERSRPKETNPDSFTLDYWNEVRVAVLAAKGDSASARAAAVALTVHHLRPSTPAFDVLNGVQTTVPDLLRLGLREEALRLLDHSARGSFAPGLEWLESAPELRPLRGEPRFERVRDTARKATVIMVKHLEEARVARELPHYLEKPLAELKVLLQPPAP